MKRKFFSQALSLLLALVMCAGMLPAAALAQNSTPMTPLEASSERVEETVSLDAAEAAFGGWVLQEQATNETTEIQPEWITVTENGLIIDHSKMIVDTGKQGWVLFNSAAEPYEDSVLEYDMTLSKPDDNQVGFINIAPATRVIDGKNYEGFAIDTPGYIQRTGRKDGAESYGGVDNLPGMSFEYGKTYHLRMVTIGSHITVYVTVDGGAEQMLTAFDSPIGLGASTYGFRIWRGGKTITIENIERTELVNSTLGKTEERIESRDWGTADVSIPVTFGEGDSIQSIANGEAALTGQDYAVEGNTLTLKKEYIDGQTDSFTLKVEFAKGSAATLQIIKYNVGVQQEYIWTPDKGLDEWTKLSGSGAFTMSEGVNGDAGMLMKGQNFLMNENAPVTTDGEIEITCEFMSDAQSCVIGGLFRADKGTGAWQSVGTNRDYNATAYWDFTDSNGTGVQLVWDGALWVSRLGVKDHKIKVRCEGDSMSIWLDDQFTHTASVSQAKQVSGGMGLQTAATGDVLVKKVVFREVVPFEQAKGERVTESITKDGLTVRLDGDFPRVVDYTLNGKSMKGAELRYNYVAVNTVNLPAAAEITAQTADSVTYHVTPDQEKTGVTFDVKMTVLDSQILEMLILNIQEPEDEPVYSITLPRQPLISANSAETGAKLDAAWGDKNNWGIKDIHETIRNKTVSTTADRSVIIPIITNGQLSASMANNVYIDGDEFAYRAFDLENGEVSVGAWNNDFMYRGLDGEKILPFASEPDENDLYCRVAITEDTNGDAAMDWQDGANALKKLVSGLIPGGDDAARSFFHVGYNFASGVQQPFLQVADNMKRLSNSMDGFGQNLIFKGYANEGHDSGHADYQDINHRAGGADAMNVAIEEGHKINSNFGIHINAHEAYPEAKMFNDHLISDRNAWWWMDQSRNIRRDIDMLEGSFDARLDDLFSQTPDLDFVYVDCWEGDRWDELKLVGNMLRNGAEGFGTENATDLGHFGVWVHSTGNTVGNGIHQFVFNSQKDIYPSTPIYWGGYNRGASMMSWQHQNNLNTMVSQFYTNQLPQKYLMCHDVLKNDGTTGTFSGNVTSSNWVITKDGSKITDGQGNIFIPWYAEDSVKRDPDEAAKIYHWNSAGGSSTWTLPQSWNVSTVYLYQNTQTGKKLVETLDVTDHQVTINAKANTPYVVYPGEAAPDVTEWSVGSPIKDTNFNSRDFSIWQKTGDAAMAFNDDGNGVSILTMTGADAGQVSQTMTGLTAGQKYRVLVYAGAENGKTARITVTDGDKTYENYVERIAMNNQYFDNYALGKPVQLVWVDFTAAAETAVLTLSADACEKTSGKATFMQTRIVKTAEPDLPKGYVAKETFEYVEQGAYGVFNPERAADGVPHLSETHLPYTNDTINGSWSLKLTGRAGGVNLRTNPTAVRLTPGMDYSVEFDTLGGGKVYVVSESDGTDKCLEESFSAGHSEFAFTTGGKTDYIIRIEGGSVLDDFEVYGVYDPTPPTQPTDLTATAVADSNSVKLTWTAATDDDGRVGSYRVYRDGALLAIVGNETSYLDQKTEDETEYTYQVSAVNVGSTEGDQSTGAAVTTGILPPAAVKAGLSSTATAAVTFNKDMDKASAETVENYTLTGVDAAAVTAAVLKADRRTVTLTLSGMTACDTATLTIANVKDASGKHTVAGTDALTLSLMDHYFKLDEAANTDAVDEMGKTNGVKSSAVASAGGKAGKAASFSGSGYIDVSSDALYRADTFSVAAWIKWDGSSGVNAIVGNDISGDASSRGIIFFVDGGSGILRTNSNVCACVGNKSVTANEWHHVVFVKQTGSAQLYLDGEQIANDAVQFGIEDRVPFRIGGSSKMGGGLSYPFHGAIDEVKIFAGALTAADAAKLAEAEMEATPEAVFDAATMTLSDVTDRMEYSVNGGITWVKVTGTTVDLSAAALTTANGIQVKQLGDGSATVDSEVQTIILTQAGKPEGVTARDETSAKNDGAILGTTAAMEYRAQGSAGWTVCGAGTTAVAPGTYEVRVAGKGTVLASGTVTVTVNAATYSIEIKADQTSVQVGKDVTVTVTAKGGQFVGAACKMTFESDKFTVKSAPDGWEAKGDNAYTYYNVINSGFYPEDMVLGDFVFTAKELKDETTGSFSLSDTYLVGEWKDGWSTDPAEQVPNNGSVSVKITLVPTYVVEIVKDYVAGYSLVLVYTDGERIAYSYGGEAMYDVTSAGYEYQGTKYTHVYGLVTDDKDASADKVASAEKSAGTLTYTTDVNGSNKTDLNDAVAVVAVYNANGLYMNAIHMDIVLKADVNGDKKVDVDDFGLIKAKF